MHFPTTNDGWTALAAITSAITALFNLILIGFLARYTIRQTELLATQTKAIEFQKEMTKIEATQRGYRDIHAALSSLYQIRTDVCEVHRYIQGQTIGQMTLQSIRPNDWPESASCLITYYPSMIPLPSQLDIELRSADEALTDLRKCSSASERKATVDKLTERLRVVDTTITRIEPHLSVPSSH